MGAEELHLVGQDISALKIDVFGMGRGEWYRQQFHPSPFRGESGLVVVAAQAGRDHVVPVIGSAQAQWPHMVT